MVVSSKLRLLVDTTSVGEDAPAPPSEPCPSRATADIVVSTKPASAPSSSASEVGRNLIRGGAPVHCRDRARLWIDGHELRSDRCDHLLAGRSEEL
jgi:hypothetical protein